MSASTSPPTLMTAEEFVVKHDRDRVELVRGVVVELPMPEQNHGKVCATFARHLGNWAEANDCGHVMSNDSFIRTTRGPDSVRGPDINYFSYARQPKGRIPPGLLDAAPEFVVEVRSPSDRMRHLVAKVSEYLASGILAVLILDPDMAAATVFRDNELPQTFHNGDTLTVPDVLPGFAVPLARLFD